MALCHDALDPLRKALQRSKRAPSFVTAALRDERHGTLLTWA